MVKFQKISRCFSGDGPPFPGSASSSVRHSQGSQLPGATTLRVRHSQCPPFPGSANPRVLHSQGETLYSVSEQFINPASVSANYYYFNQFQSPLTQSFFH